MGEEEIQQYGVSLGEDAKKMLHGFGGFENSYVNQVAKEQGVIRVETNRGPMVFTSVEAALATLFNSVGGKPDELLLEIVNDLSKVVGMMMDARQDIYEIEELERIRAKLDALAVTRVVNAAYKP